MTLDFPDTDTVLATARASAGRRLIGLVSLGFLGVFLIYVAFTSTPGLGWQLFLLVIGGGAIWMADFMRRSTAGTIELTAAVLRSSDGTLIARVEDIEHIDRGVFAFKPSNGFLLRTKKETGAETVWRPGLWWRMGRRIGVGGMTPGNQTKYMAEIISTMIAVRNQPDETGRL
ncbi:MULTISPECIES: hypothetical protein [unclassified Sulfitobacter]|jgi:hypothetical protein|uniref:hypothetical protein n=1 Tax=unclassified Sulfitobacter TaxID=196795 RepID=UPI001593DDB5|nr:hypothetical protein [Sulfitobacter sp. HGT1]MBQ0804878.1 hypothetical protein [Sulfitobacter sp.]